MPPWAWFIAGNIALILVAPMLGITINWYKLGGIVAFMLMILGFQIYEEYFG